METARRSSVLSFAFPATAIDAMARNRGGSTTALKDAFGPPQPSSDWTIHSDARPSAGRMAEPRGTRYDCGWLKRPPGVLHARPDHRPHPRDPRPCLPRLCDAAPGALLRETAMLDV